MSIQTYIEIGCDYCKQADHFHTASKAEAVRQYRSEPSVHGIVTAAGKHFCDQDCYNAYKRQVK